MNFSKQELCVKFKSDIPGDYTRSLVAQGGLYSRLAPFRPHLLSLQLAAAHA